ncbi:hypothetical protein SADUNF_Sadunf18G0008100 [Salix dunnii]|uniref:Uncharacterized protein n=1 Tax=Salix dunnii TaxID=1413687 RepID=A0A835J4R5_9ROSI|nr:hypothetical protein SADUNF_Sadunf18G0008100 [Salix dunnii]
MHPRGSVIHVFVALDVNMKNLQNQHDHRWAKDEEKPFKGCSLVLLLLLCKDFVHINGNG